MARVTRRKFLKVSGAGALAAKTGGMAGILATGRAPAYAQATTVHWLRWNDFVPASDQLLRKEMLPEAEKALGIKINFETVNGNDLQPRITAAIQSGAGPDLIMLFNNHPQLYAASLVDMSDVAEEVGKAEGGYYPLVKSNSQRRQEVDFHAVDHHRRHDRLSQVVVRGGRLADSSPTPGRSIARSARSSRPRAGRIGQTLGHTFGDAPTFTYPYLWSWGGKEVEADGKTWSSTARRPSSPSSS